MFEDPKKPLSEIGNPLVSFVEQIGIPTNIIDWAGFNLEEYIQKNRKTDRQQRVSIRSSMDTLKIERILEETTGASSFNIVLASAIEHGLALYAQKNLSNALYFYELRGRMLLSDNYLANQFSLFKFKTSDIEEKISNENPLRIRIQDDHHHLLMRLGRETGIDYSTLIRLCMIYSFYTSHALSHYRKKFDIIIRDDIKNTRDLAEYYEALATVAFKKTPKEIREEMRALVKKKWRGWKNESLEKDELEAEAK